MKEKPVCLPVTMSTRKTKAQKSIPATFSGSEHYKKAGGRYRNLKLSRTRQSVQGDDGLPVNQRQHSVSLIASQTHENKRKATATSPESVNHSAKSSHAAISRRFLCTSCHKSFTRLIHLQIHERSHSGVKPYICRTCKRGFAAKKSLEVHERTHSGEKPFSCQYCGVCFTQLSHVQRHERTHNGERPHTCYLCPRAFSDTKTLENHVRTHTGEKPFVCNSCPKTFSQVGHLRRHQFTHLQERARFVCFVCQKSFLSMSSLQKHERSHKTVSLSVERKAVVTSPGVKKLPCIRCCAPVNKTHNSVRMEYCHNNKNKWPEKLTCHSGILLTRRRDNGCHHSHRCKSNLYIGECQKHSETSLEPDHSQQCETRPKNCLNCSVQCQSLTFHENDDTYCQSPILEFDSVNELVTTEDHSVSSDWQTLFIANGTCTTSPSNIENNESEAPPIWSQSFDALLCEDSINVPNYFEIAKLEQCKWVKSCEKMPPTESTHSSNDISLPGVMMNFEDLADSPTTSHSEDRCDDTNAFENNTMSSVNAHESHIRQSRLCNGLMDNVASPANIDVSLPVSDVDLPPTIETEDLSQSPNDITVAPTNSVTDMPTGKTCKWNTLESSHKVIIRDTDARNVGFGASKQLVLLSIMNESHSAIHGNAESLELPALREHTEVSPVIDPYYRGSLQTIASEPAKLEDRSCMNRGQEDEREQISLDRSLGLRDRQSPTISMEKRVRHPINVNVPVEVSNLKSNDTSTITENPGHVAKIKRGAYCSGRSGICCSYCGKLFKTRDGVSLHERQFHTGENTHDCPTCGKIFSTRKDLATHRRVHTGERPFLCHICSRSFTQLSHLQRHTFTHTGEKPYRCQDCNKSFSQQSTLKKHHLTHAGLKPFTCHFCQKSFTQLSNLKTHEYTHTGKGPRPFRCAICPKAFAYSCHLKVHEGVHCEGNQSFKCKAKKPNRFASGTHSFSRLVR